LIIFRVIKNTVKLTLQIAFGVFLGSLASQLVIDGWHSRQEEIAKADMEKLRADQEKIRREQGERVRALLLKGRGNAAGVKKPPTGFVPDDVQIDIPKEN
jgi:hypothetical protein